MKSKSVKISEIAKDENLRMDAQYWINKKDESKISLNPDLKMYLNTTPMGIPMIKHPLVFEIFYQDISLINDRLNKMYEYKTKELEKSLENKKYDTYIFLHERPYRLFAFTKIMNDLDDKTYWELLGEIWVDSENIWQNKNYWKELLKSKRGDREYFMNEEERELFKDLEPEIDIYRGYLKNKNKSGFSYSIDEETAQWFSTRFGDGDVLHKRIKKEEAFALINRRNENEIIYFK